MAKYEVKIEVAVRSPNWLGDAIMALPAIKALAGIFGDPSINGVGSITILAREGLEDIFGRFPFVRDVVTFNRTSEARIHWGLSLSGVGKIILFTNSFRSAWNGYRTGAPLRAGYSGNFRSLLLTHRMPPDKTLHMTDYYLNLLKVFGKSGFSKEIEFPLYEVERDFAASLGDLNGAVGIPLGARFGPAKCWPEEKLKELIGLIRSRTKRVVVLFGTKAERVQATELVEFAKTVSPENGAIIDLTGRTTIGEMAAVMRSCEWIVANDSGPLHLAAAVGAKVLALFGSTDPVRTAPLSGNVRIINKSVECAPCYKRECPIDFRCMQEIGAEEVFDIIEGKP
ncbi:MAG: lipopolysaccharide heptosyltransferase II [Nitrospinota bacterium]|nr:lipopolysaccharide heptosyltransferase II [Nitrospinota bacterium]